MRLTLVAIACLSLGRHPLHTTHTDLAEGPGGRVTMTVRSFSDDLRAAIARREHVVDDSSMARYVRSTVALQDRTGRTVALMWDSSRSEGDITLLSLHATIAGGLSGASVRQAMQMELHDDQVNVLQSRYAGQSVSLLFLSFLGPAVLLSAPAGVVADRFDRRHILIVTNLIRAAAFTAVVG